jgi:hypothetical protein
MCAVGSLKALLNHVFSLPVCRNPARIAVLWEEVAESASGGIGANPALAAAYALALLAGASIWLSVDLVK